MVSGVPQVPSPARLFAHPSSPRLLRTGLLICSAVIVLTGCVEVEQEITLKKSNSGSFKIFVSMPIDIYDTFLKTEGTDSVTRFFDAAAGSAYFSEAEGFKVARYRVYDNENDGRKYARIEGKLTDAEKALASGKLGDFELKKMSGGITRLALRAPKRQRPRTKADNEKLTEVFEGMKLKLVLEVPGDIAKTSASEKSGDTAEWTFSPADNTDFVSAFPDVYVEYK
jgi:hypothetical protein